LFADLYGEEPAGLWVAPGRVNLIGEHTDYNDGFVLPFALPLVTAVAASPVHDGPRWTVHSEGFGDPAGFDVAAADQPGTVEGWAAYVAGVVWTLRDDGHNPPGARLAIATDVPLGAGLSSSAALECAVLTALADLGDLPVPVQRRPRLAQRAENIYVGMPCGIMDQSAATLCRAGHALFLDCRSLAVEHIPFDVAAQGLAVLVVDTCAPHRHVTGEYAARRATCEAAAKALGLTALRDIEPGTLDDALARLDDETSRRRVRHVVTENQRVLDTVAALHAGDVRTIGPLMTASHASMRDDYEITVAEVDTAVEAALHAGAYGARMTGGGFGGCVLALVDADRADATAAAIAEAFAANGFGEPKPFVAVPGGGAHGVTPPSTWET
jgi:galactokinase